MDGMKITQKQQLCTIGIIDNLLLRPVDLPPRSIDVQYLNFLEHTLPDPLENVPLNVRGDLVYVCTTALHSNCATVP